ncbi:cache domain-containing protein [Acinetobacter larvae]|uniref:Histidine kinase n=1 Tax=Acinetobacter larvae TaxID=1789224 RepID=A0A1B2M1Q0_9GAMM|nr:cache domain-containing protein [Acinetobacter larvae]AOA59126.1 histidine kinase [Acinetobacter larvae]
MTQNQYIAQLQQLLQQVLDETTAHAQHLAVHTKKILSHHLYDITKGIKLTAEERRHLQGAIKTTLSDSHYSHGMGFASYSPETLDSEDYWTLEWWYKTESQLQQAKLENYQNAQRFLDFRSFEWFQQPAQNKRPYIHGPYVDYICNSAYTITVAHPVMLQDQFIGVIAIDILVSALEKVLMPSLKNIHQTAVIINDVDRVVTSNAVSIKTGTLLKHHPHQQCIPSPPKPLQLVVLS